MLKASCLTDDPLTPPARLAAVDKRLDTMLQAVKMVSSSLNDFYGTLSDEQKAQFEACSALGMSRRCLGTVVGATSGELFGHFLR